MQTQREQLDALTALAPLDTVTVRCLHNCWIGGCGRNGNDIVEVTDASVKSTLGALVRTGVIMVLSVSRGSDAGEASASEAEPKDEDLDTFNGKQLRAKAVDLGMAPFPAVGVKNVDMVAAIQAHLATK